MPLSGLQAGNTYTDISSLQTLKGRTKDGDHEATKQVAKQFEAIFLQMMLASMRKTVQVNEEFGNEKSMYYDLFDKQVAIEMSNRGGIGITKMMMSQLGVDESKSNNEKSAELNSLVTAFTNNASLPKSSGVSTDVSKLKEALSVKEVADVTFEDVKTNIDKAVPAAEVEDVKTELNFNSPIEFIRQLWHSAGDMIAEKGLDPRAIIAQAALETGWGKHVIKKSDGESSHNMFGIKSNNGWSGDKVLANTLEYKDGVMARAKESFRSYDSLVDSVKDYVQFISDNARYKDAVANQNNPERYVQELQRAGYATDPNYADKIINIINGKEFKQFFDATGIKVDG